MFKLDFASKALTIVICLLPFAVTANASVSRCERNQGPQKLVVLFDGTWNDVGTETNVLRLSREIERKATPGSGIHVRYVDGVGADARQLTGGSMGYGFARNVREGYSFVSSCFQPGDKIYIFGFSRGAFSARTLAAVIQQVGVLNANAFEEKRADGSTKFREAKFRNAVEEAYKIQKDAGKESYAREHPDKPLRTLNDFWRNITVKEAKQDLKDSRAKANPGVPVLFDTGIEVVGVWDTVGALGLSHDAKEPLYLVRLNDLPGLRRAYQALSLDESRPSFWPVLWADQAVTGTHELDEVWFPGAHSDVGGGYHPASVEFGTKNLADLSLSWMADKLRRDDLVGPNFGVLSKEQRALLSKALRHSPTQPLTKAKTFLRIPADGSSIHWSVCERLRLEGESVEGVEGFPIYRPKGVFAEDSSMRNALNWSSAAPSDTPCEVAAVTQSARW